MLWAALLMGCRAGPDVLFLTIDTLRYDHVGAFNSESAAKTPHIDALAEDAIRFTSAYSPISVTGPAFATLHTGMDPSEHGVVINMFRGGTPLNERFVTMAELLSEKGYATGAFVSGFTLHPQLNLDQGFDLYSFPMQRQARRAGAETVEEALSWMNWRMGNYFLWFHTYDPHGPWEPWASADEVKAQRIEELQPKVTNKSSELESAALQSKKLTKESSARLHTLGAKKDKSSYIYTTYRPISDKERIPKYQYIEGIETPDFYKTLYARGVEAADQQVGEIIMKLKEQGRYDDAIIVLTADHGESFTERDLWFDHGTFPSEEQLHVPLLIKLPKSKDAGLELSELMGLRDIMPMLLDILKIDTPQDVSGKNILAEKEGWSYLFGESSHCKKEVSLQCYPWGPAGKIFSLRTTEETFWISAEEEQTTFVHFDLKKSPDELEANEYDLGSSSREQQRLFERLLETRTSRKPELSEIPWPPKNPNMRKGAKKSKNNLLSEEELRSEEELELLKQLGYIDE